MKKLPLAAAITSAMLSFSASAAYTDAGTDYTTTTVDSHIADEAFEPLEMVNMFLCIIKATGAETLWDQDYRALVDDDKCEQQSGAGGGEQRESSDRSTSSQVEYANVVVNSSRADSASPQIVNAQYSIDDEDGLERYLVRTQLDSAPGVNAPFGELRFTWKEAANPDDNKGDLRIFNEGSTSIIKMIDQFNDGGPAVSQKMRIQIDDAAGTSGSGIIEGWDWQFSRSITYRIAYDSQYLLKSDGINPDECQARPETIDPIEKIWGYSLFNETSGALLDIEAGFGFRYFDAPSGETRHGYIGNWGMWTDNDDSPTTITHERTDVEYTVVNAPGKLIRQRKGLRNLANGETFEVFAETSPGSGNWQPTQIIWVAGSSQFEGVNGNGDPDGNNANIAVGSFLWSPSLRQDINYQGDTDSNSIHEVAFSTQEVVHPTDAIFSGGEATLTCFGDCPKPNVTKSEALAWDLFDGNHQDPASDPGTDYTLDPADMTLRVGGDPVSLAFSRSELNSGEEFWGSSVGEFVLQVDAASISGWDDLNSEGTVTYRWEYGLDSWSQLTLVKDGNGDYFEFDKPISLQYSHTTNRDGSAGNGKLYLLDYQGARNLHGIPWTEVGSDWQPEVNIPDGTQLVHTDGQGTITNYRVKAVGIEKRMADASGLCGSLTLPNPASFPLPDFVDADVANALDLVEPTTFFDALTVSDEPRVIHGVVQD
ncbi:MAG: hypothetical protein V7752_15425 [Halopseudomonas sp.]